MTPAAAVAAVVDCYVLQLMTAGLLDLTLQGKAQPPSRVPFSALMLEYSLFFTSLLCLPS